MAGPISLKLFAAIDQEDTNWFVALKDVGPDVSVMSVREGERERPDRRARTRSDPRLAEGIDARNRSQALKAVEALALSDPRCSKADRARRGQRIRHRGHGNCKHVP